MSDTGRINSGKVCCHEQRKSDRQYSVKGTVYIPRLRRKSKKFAVAGVDWALYRLFGPCVCDGVKICPNKTPHSKSQIIVRHESVE